MNESATNADAKKVCDGRISPAREKGRARFREMLSEHLKAAVLAGRPLVKPFAAALDVSRQYVEKQASVLHDKPSAQLACGDLNALEPALLVPLLRRWLEQAEADLAPPRPAAVPERLVARLARRLGAAADTVQEAVSPSSDGGEETTDAEWRQIEVAFEAAEEEARNGKLAARAAVKRGAR